MSLPLIIRDRLRLRYVVVLIEIAHLSDALKRACCKHAQEIIIEVHERLAEARFDAADHGESGNNGPRC